MALVCPACGTENRSSSKFCIECIGPLAAEFEATLLEPRITTSERLSAQGMPSALASFATAGPPTEPVRIAPPPMVAPEGRKGLWVSVAALAIALAVGAAGWAAAGAGGFYIYRSASAAPTERESAPTPEPAPVVAAVAVPVAPAAEPTPAAEPAPVEQAATVAPVAPLAPPAPAAHLASNSPRPTSKPHSSNAAPRVASADAGPNKACAGLGFFAKSRCMVNECEKAAYRQMAECKSVQAQQRLMEEKRNPTY
jgi:hypothetical protein